VILLVSISANTQNLISNGGFESYTTLPTYWSQSDRASGWTNVSGIYTGFHATPDYYNTLSFNNPNFGNIQPNTGNGQMGILFSFLSPYEYREYIATQLSTSLIVGQKYQLSFYVTNGLNGVFPAKSNKLGAHFSVSPLIQNNIEAILVSPQVEIQNVINHTNFWQKYTYTFIADNPSNYFSFGVFRDNANTTVTGGFESYYFLDDFELIVMPQIKIQGDTVICLGESATLNAFGDITIGWADSLNPSNIISTDSTISVSPITTTTYFAFSASDTAYIRVNVINPPLVNLGNDTTLCREESLNLDVSAPNANYLWQDNSVNPIFNVTQSGTYSVEVTENNCSSSDTIIVNYNPLTIIYLGADTTLCQAEILELDATTSNANYIWQNNSTSSTFNVNQQGTYWVKVTVDNCSASDTITINFKPSPIFDLGLDAEMCQNDTIVLDATTSNATYLWQDNSTDSIFYVTKIGEYWVEVTVNECTAIDYITINYKCESILEIPNIFTPNGDGINDYFVPVKSEGIVSIQTVILNRWGNVVFETDDLLINWDGQNVNDGTYFWIIEYVDLNGGENKIHGFVNVVK
jgi:gliding motility-associated-like protein